ncbi:MAG: 30S ribosomal protein S8 [Dehalococcoidia bacterium]|jgi:small subunit ribosomal protein S8|nr:30S ribosomal protein S8 [Dehalococcoidia bacterium]MDP7239696.1 30S ribosomal protein S8 [Dehalococcoidia bacterium]MDP7469914.1 30S ribosomal protein S8 [Dehalococcoidia bacterium]
MTVTDPIADMLTRIRNAVMVRHDSVLVPASTMKLAIAKILKEEGFIEDFEILRGKPQRVMKVRLRYMEGGAPAITGLKRVSRPGLRVYVGSTEIPRLFGGIGVSIVSSHQGVITGHQARRQQVGGELLCYIW